VAGFDSLSRSGWTRVNAALAICATLTLGGATAVFLFAVVWTHGVYGSRIAWFLGVVLPLLAVTAAFAWGAARYGIEPDSPSDVGVWQGPEPPSPYGKRDPRRAAAKGIGVGVLILIGIPFAFAGMLLFTYGLIFIAHTFR
jgi:hypothetical protein